MLLRPRASVGEVGRAAVPVEAYSRSASGGRPHIALVLSHPAHDRVRLDEPVPLARLLQRQVHVFIIMQSGERVSRVVLGPYPYAFLPVVELARVSPDR